MIQISRRNIRTIRTMIRQTLGITSSRRAPAVTLRNPDSGGVLRIQSATAKAAIEFRLESLALDPDSFSIPYQALMSCEGSQEELVNFVRNKDEVIVQWTDAGIPQSLTFSAGEPVEMPPVATLTSIEPRFIAAISDAVDTTSTESTRFALDCVRLRGSDGQLAASDGGQAILETGFHFPWSDTVLVPACDVFSSREFAAAEEVLIGRSDDWVTVQANACTVHLKIEKERCFPDLDLQIPGEEAAVTKLALADTDVSFLLESAPKLPAAEETNAPVTIELNGVVAIRAAAEASDQITELVLSNSRRVGEEILFQTDRTFLCRAAQLGFREIQLRDNTAPAYCRDDRRMYLWALLDEESVLRASDETTRISSPVVSDSLPQSKGKSSTMVTTASSRAVPARASTASSNDTEVNPNLLTQAETLRDSLNQALSDTRELITLIKRNQKQNRLVETTLRSLKQLEQIAS
jgi:hypothetical protein